MTLIKEVADVVKEIGEVIKSTREIVKAINDGRAFLEKYHNDAKVDLVALLQEMRLTLNGLSDVSGVITAFQFTIAGRERDSEPRRFNDYVIAKTTKLDELEGRKRSLKGSCDKIRKHRDSMDRQAHENWSGWALLLGEKKKRRREKLASDLGCIYADDVRILDLITQELDAARAALREVTKALGGSAGASPKNVPKAAKVLGEYALAFEALQRQCSEIAEELRQLIDQLT